MKADARKPEDGYTLDEISNQYLFYNKSQLGTLNRAVKYSEDDEKSTLGFVIVFKGQHPRWPPKIFCKTNLFLLPKTDTLPSMSSDSLKTGRKTARSVPCISTAPTSLIYHELLAE